MVELHLESVSKTFPPSHTALDDITLTIAPGECLALVGPSGCGKTTLLRVIAGLEEPSAGAVRIDGRRIDELPCHRRGVAMLFQRPALMPQQTVTQNLRAAWTLREPWSFLRRILGKDAGREQDLLRIARSLGLEADLDRPAGQLSGGQQQRVALGRCLLRKAQVLLLDEPLGHLDAPLRTELRRQIRALAREAHVTMIHVTHDPDEALTIGDRIAVMKAGAIVQIDDAAQLRRAPNSRYVAELIHRGAGGLNLVCGHVVQEGIEAHFENPFGRWPIPLQSLHRLRESLFQAKNTGPGHEKVAIMIGVPAKAVLTSTDRLEDGEEIRLQMPARELECTTADSWVIAADERGQWIGRADRASSFKRGQTVTMTFAMEHAYWFDVACGRTLAAPTC